MSKELKDKLLDDLLMLGECVIKTEIIDGKPTIKYIDPISDELMEALYNAEHSDSKTKITKVKL